MALKQQMMIVENYYVPFSLMVTTSVFMVNLEVIYLLLGTYLMTLFLWSKVS